MLLRAHLITLLSAMLEQWSGVKRHPDAYISPLETRAVRTHIEDKWSSGPCKGLPFHKVRNSRNQARCPSQAAALWQGDVTRQAHDPALRLSSSTITYCLYQGWMGQGVGRHPGDCWLPGQSKGVNAGKEAKFSLRGPGASQNPHFFHLHGWCDVHVGHRTNTGILTIFAQLHVLTPFQLNYLLSLT